MIIGKRVRGIRDEMLALADEWDKQAEPLAFHGEMYDGAEEEADDAVASTLNRCASALRALAARL